MADKLMPTDEEGWRWVREAGFGANLIGRVHRRTVWHAAAGEGRIDMCRWLKAKGVADEINVVSKTGKTPLMVAMVAYRTSPENVNTMGWVVYLGPTLPTATTTGQLVETIRWMMANGADVKAIDNRQRTVFCHAVMSMSVEFVHELADKVPPEHLTLPEKKWGNTPMACAVSLVYKYTAHGAADKKRHGASIASIVKMLVLRGVPMPTHTELSASLGGPSKWHRQVPSWPFMLTNYSWFYGQVAMGISTPHGALAEIATRDTFVNLPDGIAAELATRDTFVNLVLGCGVHSRNLPHAQRSQLHKLRGSINTQARMNIAQYLGVRVGEEAGRLRRASATLTPQRTPAPAPAPAPAPVPAPVPALSWALFPAPAPALATQISVLTSPAVLVMTTLFFGTWIGIWQAERRSGGCRGRLRL